MDHWIFYQKGWYKLAIGPNWTENFTNNFTVDNSDQQVVCLFHTAEEAEAFTYGMQALTDHVLGKAAISLNGKLYLARKFHLTKYRSLDRAYYLRVAIPINKELYDAIECEELC